MAVRNPNTMTRQRAGDIDGPHNRLKSKTKIYHQSPHEDEWPGPVKDDERNPEAAPFSGTLNVE